MNRYVRANRHVDQRARLGESLTPAEVEIVRLLAVGARDGEIAVALEISDRTYRRHLTAALRKLGARTRAHAVVLAARAGLIDLPVTSVAGEVSG